MRFSVDNYHDNVVVDHDTMILKVRSHHRNGETSSTLIDVNHLFLQPVSYALDGLKEFLIERYGHDL